MSDGEVIVGDKKDFNVNLDFLNTYASEYFSAIRISAALMVGADNESIQQAFYDKLREKIYILLEAMISSQRFNEWEPKEKLKTFLQVSYKFTKPNYLRIHDLLTEISEQNSAAKVMDVQAKRIKTKNMLKANND